MQIVYLIATLLFTPLAQAAVHCSIHGDTHVLMSDGATKYQHHSAGLYRAFATSYGTKRLEVQCEFTDRVVTSSQIIDPQMSSCRLRVVDTTIGCGLDLRHGGVEQPGVGSIGGRDMPLAAMTQISLNPALGVQIVPLTNNALSIEVNWNGTMVQVIMGERLLQVHSSMVTQCIGLCGTCVGQQSAPTDPNALNNFIAQYVVQPSAAIQPDACFLAQVASRPLTGTTPQLFQQSTTPQYPVPAYRPASFDDSMYQAQFESQAVLMQVFQQCSDSDQMRLSVDPWFNSFIEDCIYDKSLGPGFESSAKSSMDAYVTWTESLLRWVRIDAALRQSPAMPLCAACIPVQWTDPVNTNAILTPTVTMRQGSLRFPLRYSSTASQYLVPGRFVRAFAGQDFATQSWNTPITLSPLSTLNLAPLPQQLVSSPIVVGSNSKDVAAQAGGLTWNPLPTNQGGICGVMDAPTMAAYEQLASQFMSGSQTQQLVQLIRQGRYPFLACALTCISTSSSILATLASTVQPMEAALLCPAQQYNSAQQYNQFNGNMLLNNGVNGFPYNTFNGFNGLTNNMLNGFPVNSNYRPISGVNNLDPNSILNNFPANGINNFPANGINNFPANGINNFPVNGINNNFPANGINNFPVNGINNFPVNGINSFPVNGINSFPVNGINNFPVNGINNFPVNGVNNVNSLYNFPVNGVNNFNGLNAMNGLNALNSVNNMQTGLQQPNQVLGQNSVPQINAFMF